MQMTIEMLKALSDENRFRIFMLLKYKRMCVCEMLRILDIAGSTLSAHLKILRNAGLIEQRKDGRWIEYYINEHDERVNRLYTLIDDSMIKDRSVLDRDREIAAALSREVCSHTL